MSSQYRRDVQRHGAVRSFERVVVIGASAAGLLAAAAAAGAGRTVTVLERDALDRDGLEPESAPGAEDGRHGPEPRSGVPQGRQPHIFLHRGLQDTELLLPGFREDLLAVGAIPFDTAELAWLGESGWNPLEAKSFDVLSTTRPLLEQTIRVRVAALSGVEIRSGCTVVGLKRDDSVWQAKLSDGSLVDADLVIDASGRGSRMTTWLVDVLSSPVKTTEIDAKVGYATRMYRGDPAIGNLPGVVIAPVPAHPAGGLAIPVEGGRWMVLAVGVGEHRPPRSNDGFQDFLSNLRDPALSQVAERMDPLTDAAIYRQTGNIRRRYEEVADWPDGLLVVGDALCALNPVYGQGISVGAAEAVLLRDALRAPTAPDLRRLQRAFADVVATPWSIATGSDLRFSSCAQDPTRLGRLSNRWILQLGKLSAHGNLRAAVTLSGVYHLMMPTRRLLQPGLFWASLVASLRGYGPAVPRPAGLPLPLKAQPDIGSDS